MVLVVVATAGCGEDAPAPTHPPGDFADLQEIFDPVLDPLGFHLTRASLIERATYRESATGDHLALYVAPNAAANADEVAAAFLPLNRLVVPTVFADYAGLLSMDICQEPHDWKGSAPPSITILDITAEGSSLAVEWETVTLPQLVAHAGADPDMVVWVDAAVASSATWLTALG